MIPVTVLGGFLGAGKTTAINHLLRSAARRYAVLVNDFGAINVDAALIEGGDGAVLSLTNGCVCCGIGPDLGETLGRVAGRAPRPAHILIEASGVSDPWRIAQLVKLEGAVLLDAVLVLVDAERFGELLADRYVADTVARQLARADLIVLNKCDLAAPGLAEAAVLRLRPDARIARAERGALPEMLLGAGRDRGDGGRFVAEAPGHPFRTWAWRPPGAFDAAGLGRVLDGLPRSVLRLKGFCRVGPEGAPHLLQMAGRRWALTPGVGGEEGLVMIGTTALPGDEALAARFGAALAGAAPVAPGLQVSSGTVGY